MTRGKGKGLMMGPKNDFLDVILAAPYDSMSEPKVVGLEGSGERPPSMHLFFCAGHVHTPVINEGRNHS